MPDETKPPMPPATASEATAAKPVTTPATPASAQKADAAKSELQPAAKTPAEPAKAAPDPVKVDVPSEASQVAAVTANAQTPPPASKQPTPAPISSAQFKTINGQVAALWLANAPIAHVKSVADAIKVKARELGVTADSAMATAPGGANSPQTFTHSVSATLAWVDSVALPKPTVTEAEAAAGKRPDHPRVVEKREEHLGVFRSLLATVEKRFGEK